MATRRNGPINPKDQAPVPTDKSMFTRGIDRARPDPPAAQDKQARLLAEENPGHFSLVRALHLADFITELNGMRKPRPHLGGTVLTTHPQASAA